jgi:predicted DsbA family dithiol-disulfide isomerase
MQIDVFADPICPWCYIGKRRLERALAHRNIEGARIRWRVYQINPDMPACGMARKDYLKSKFGGVDQAQKIFNAIARVGRSEGIDFAFERIGEVPNTTQAHRLIRFALDTPHLDTLIETLFRHYLVEGGCIGRIESLIELAVESGLDRAAVTRHMECNSDDIGQQNRVAHRLGVQNAPFFIVNKQYALSGAQEPEAFYPLFDIA